MIAINYTEAEISTLHMALDLAVMSAQTKLRMSAPDEIRYTIALNQIRDFSELLSKATKALDKINEATI